MHQYTWLYQRFEDKAKRAAKTCRSGALGHEPFDSEIVENLTVKRLKAELPGRYGASRMHHYSDISGTGRSVIWPWSMLGRVLQRSSQHVATYGKDAGPA